MAGKKYSAEIANAINNFLTDKELRFTYDDQNGIFRMGWNISGGLKLINVSVLVRKDDFVVYGIAPIGAEPENKQMMAEMTEFMNRVNYVSYYGNFEMNMRNGEIRYRYFVDCDDIFPSENMIRDSLGIPVAMFEKCGKGIVSIIFVNASAEDAFNMCMNKDKS